MLKNHIPLWPVQPPSSFSFGRGSVTAHGTERSPQRAAGASSIYVRRSACSGLRYSRLVSTPHPTRVRRHRRPDEDPRTQIAALRDRRCAARRPLGLRTFSFSSLSICRAAAPVCVSTSAAACLSWRAAPRWRPHTGLSGPSSGLRLPCGADCLSAWRRVCQRPATVAHDRCSATCLQQGTLCPIALEARRCFSRARRDSLRAGARPFNRCVARPVRVSARFVQTRSARATGVAFHASSSGPARASDVASAQATCVAFHASSLGTARAPDLQLPRL